jgi:hypothetical protein
VFRQTDADSIAAGHLSYRYVPGLPSGKGPYLGAFAKGDGGDVPRLDTRMRRRVEDCLGSLGAMRRAVGQAIQDVLLSLVRLHRPGLHTTWKFKAKGFRTTMRHTSKNCSR